jgi:hypothetical protein
MEVQNLRGPQIQYDLWKLAQQKWSRDAENTVKQVLKNPVEDASVRSTSYNSNDPFANVVDSFVSSIPDNYQDGYGLDNYSQNKVPEVDNFAQQTDRFERSNTDAVSSNQYYSKPEPAGETEKASAHKGYFDMISQRIQNNPGFVPVSNLRTGDNQSTGYYDAVRSTQQMNTLPKSVQRQGVMINAVDGVIDFVSMLLS